MTEVETQTSIHFILDRLLPFAKWANLTSIDDSKEDLTITVVFAAAGHVELPWKGPVFPVTACRGSSETQAGYLHARLLNSVLYHKR